MAHLAPCGVCWGWNVQDGFFIHLLGIAGITGITAKPLTHEPVGNVLDPNYHTQCHFWLILLVKTSHQLGLFSKGKDYIKVWLLWGVIPWGPPLLQEVPIWPKNTWQCASRDHPGLFLLEIIGGERWPENRKTESFGLHIEKVKNGLIARNYQRTMFPKDKFFRM